MFQVRRPSLAFVAWRATRRRAEICLSFCVRSGVRSLVCKGACATTSGYWDHGMSRTMQTIMTDPSSQLLHGCSSTFPGVVREIHTTRLSYEASKGPILK